MLGDFKVAKLWPSFTMTANRYGCDRSVITRIVALLEERGEIPLRAARERHNNNARYPSRMRPWRRKRKTGDLLTDVELAELYAGRRYQDNPRVRT